MLGRGLNVGGREGALASDRLFAVAVAVTRNHKVTEIRVMSNRLPKLHDFEVISCATDTTADHPAEVTDTDMRRRHLMRRWKDAASLERQEEEGGGMDHKALVNTTSEDALHARTIQPQ